MKNAWTISDNKIKVLSRLNLFSISVFTGQPVNGYRIFIQILARENPHFVTNHLPTVSWKE